MSCRGLETDEQPFRILVVQLLQNISGQEDAVDHPEALTVVAAGGVEVLVVGFEESVIDAIGLAAGCRVGSKHDAILVFQEEPPRGVGLSAQLGNSGIDVDVHVGIGVEPAADLGQVFTVVCHVGADECGVRMAGDDSDPLGVQIGTLGKIFAVEEPFGVFVQFVPASLFPSRGVKKAPGSPV